MATDAQIAANRANAQLSTGPKTEAGKEAATLNNFRHGLAGAFHILPWEDEEEFATLRLGLRAEYKPHTVTEQILVDRMAQHEWLRQRALHLQNLCFNANGMLDEPGQFALYLRYQTTHERAFHKCLNDLLKLRAERRKEQIGFESQEQKKELHEARVRLANARAAHLELNTDIRSTIEARLPAHEAIPFKEVKTVLKVALEEVFGDRALSKAA
ncbi:MAG: hypothetical protein JOY54_12155 [Acidobacteriaceae bacterium]|nr:hypothetical protein [Acidobacteriaceae bacterium]